MKKILLFLIFASFFFFLPQKADAFCLTFNGKFTSDNWPDASKKLEVWCAGDNPLGPSQCSGSNQSVGPNESFSLNKCSCLVDPEGKCLQVKNLPPGCTIDKTPVACGTNGPDAVVANFHVTCPAAPTPTPVCDAPYCEDWGNPPPTCVKDGKTYYKAYKECKVDGTPVDYPEQPCGSVPSCEIPQASATPTSTPTPTVPGDGPMCNKDCSTDATVCQQATDGCTECVDNGGTKTCQAPTPTATPPGGGPTATPPGDGPTATPPGDGPTATPPGDGPTATPRPPTATPTPDFSEAMCKCDSMSVSQIIAGQPAVFTATSKVTGSDVTKAEAKQIEFVLTAGNNPASRKVIAGPERVNTTSSGGTTEVKYQAQWNINIPATVEKNVDYLARATIKCTRKTTAHAYPYTALVLSESETKGLFSIIADFFRGLFGQDSSDQTDAPSDSQIATEDDFVSIAEKNNLQLGSFAPAKVIENKCPVVKFRFQ